MAGAQHTDLEGVITPLHVACQAGDLARAAALLADPSLDLNARNETGVSAIVLAAGKGKVEVVRALLAEGRADVNLRGRRGRGALHGGCLRGHRAVVSLLLADRRTDANVTDDDGRTPLIDAIRKGHELVVRMFLEVGGEMCAPAVLAAARPYAKKREVADLLDQAMPEAGSKPPTPGASGVAWRCGAWVAPAAVRGPGLQFGTSAAVATRSLVSCICISDHAGCCCCWRGWASCPSVSGRGGGRQGGAARRQGAWASAAAARRRDRIYPAALDAHHTGVGDGG